MGKLLSRFKWQYLTLKCLFNNTLIKQSFNYYG